MTTRVMLVVGLLSFLASGAMADDALRLPITRDTWFSCVGDEGNCNTGGAAKLKFKSIQEMSLLDFDAAAFKGRTIQRATLHLRAASDDHLLRVSVSTFASEWVEGTAASYAQQSGSSTFRMQRHPDLPWAFPGSDLTAVMLGQGGTFWRMADATPPDKEGWQEVPVDPAVIAARVAGISYGLLVFDDTGSEWTRQGEQFKARHMPNRFAFSREAGAGKAPYLSVELGAEDKEPPAAPTALSSDSMNLPPGEAMVSWITPADRGPAGTLGFFVEVDGKTVPRYLIPAAGKPGQKTQMRLRDLKLPPGGEVKLTVCAVDVAGNVGSQAVATVRLAAEAKEPKFVQLGEPRGVLPGIDRLSKGMVAIIDELDKVHPVTGEFIPKQYEGYPGNNHFWCLAKEAINVHMAAARNEWIGFQLLVRGPCKAGKPAVSFRDGLSVDARFFRYRYVKTKLGPLPDPLEPMEDELSIPTADEKIEGQKYASIYCEIYVPRDAPKGWHRGTLELKIDDQKWGVPLNLDVHDFTLPDEASFLAEMNCYGLPANEMDYYRLAQQNRTFLNRVPYNQRGEVAEGCAPKWDGKKLDFSEWDKRFGPLFDGTAFSDSTRKGTPIEVFYLPMNENWPSTMREFYKDGYWADTAFKSGYRDTFVEVSRQFAAHIQEKGWKQTIFQCFLNDKNNFKQNGWSRGASPWLLDEPANWQDYWALRYFGDAFHEGVNKACPLGQPRPKLAFRCDISRPEWQRDAFDHVLDYNVVGGGAFRQYHRIVLDRKREFGQIVVDYGTANAIEDSNVQPVGWCWDSWTSGSDGVLPWQTIGTAESWQKGDELSLFYPGESIGRKGPLPSVRLKAFRRGQQDAEYLSLFSRAASQPRWAIRAALETSLKLKGERQGTGFFGGEDAGRLSYKGLLPQHFAAMRADLAAQIEAAKPAEFRPAETLHTPPRDPSLAPPAYVALWKPAETQAEDESASPSSQPDRVIVLHRPEVVSDVMIDPEAADKNLEGAARDNRLARRESCNAFLVRFDLSKATIPAGKKVQKATVSFFVWDPASKGNTKVRAFGLKTPWDAAKATWKSPAEGKTWAGGAGFAFGKDTADGGPPIVVPPELGDDTVDPPLEYRLDVTDLARAWLSGKTPNHGLAIAAEADRAVDDGQWTRIQILASEFAKKEFTPKLTLEFVD